VLQSNGKHHRESAATTEYKALPDRVHLTLAQDGWEDVAGYDLAWATAHIDAAAPAA
jgi:non-heme chloroperoxidase